MRHNSLPHLLFILISTKIGNGVVIHILVISLANTELIPLMIFSVEVTNYTRVIIFLPKNSVQHSLT